MGRNVVFLCITPPPPSDTHIHTHAHAHVHVHSTHHHRMSYAHLILGRHTHLMVGRYSILYRRCHQAALPVEGRGLLHPRASASMPPKLLSMSPPCTSCEASCSASRRSAWAARARKGGKKVGEGKRGGGGGTVVVMTQPGAAALVGGCHKRAILSLSPTSISLSLSLTLFFSTQFVQKNTGCVLHTMCSKEHRVCSPHDVFKGTQGVLKGRQGHSCHRNLGRRAILGWHLPAPIMTYTQVQAQQQATTKARTCFAAGSL